MRGVPNHRSPTNVMYIDLGPKERLVESNKIEGVQYRRHISSTVVAVPDLWCLLLVCEGAGAVVHKALNKINKNTILF